MSVETPKNSEMTSSLDGGLVAQKTSKPWNIRVIVLVTIFPLFLQDRDPIHDGTSMIYTSIKTDCCPVKVCPVEFESSSFCLKSKRGTFDIYRV